MVRNFLLLVLLAPLAAVAQQPKIYRIAVLERDASGQTGPNFAALRQGFRELGYVEGRNIAIGYRASDGDDARYPALCADAVKLEADLIVVRGAAGAAACRKATSSIPIIFTGVADPVARGLVADVGRPGGNVTGIMFPSGPIVTAARLELLRQVFPKITRIAAMMNLGGPELGRARQQLESAGRDFGISVEVFDVRSLVDLRTAFAQAANERLEAVYVVGDALMEANRKLVGDLGLRHGLPTMTAESSFVEAGSLLSYGTDTSAQYKRVPAIADRIFRGGKPAEIPVERPTLFSVAVNLKTAKALGARVPRYVLSRADRVIQ
ncbi:MAG TPA: ABC transporter substrate-binding protein [Burkholderiales bacterium]|nr:ABC transporter substrate-binding protein [Burkholderiales bacterium]